MLQVAEHVFRGSHGIIVAGLDEKDLLLEEGIVSKPATVWKEKVIILNWLSHNRKLTDSSFIVGVSCYLPTDLDASSGC